jgi:hypothetical protein
VRLSLLALSLALSCSAASAQISYTGGAGARTSSGPATPELIGTGFAGVALASDGAGSFLLNPARLAFAEPGVSASLLARRLEFDPLFSSDLDDYQNAYSLTAGFPLRETNWRAGLGFGRSLYLSEQTRTDVSGNDLGTFETEDSALVLGASIAYEGPVTLSFGVAARRISEPYGGVLPADDTFEIENEAGWGVDLGLQARYAFLKPKPDGGLSGSVGIGYAIQNWGPDLSLSSSYSLDEEEETAVEYPIPLAARARFGWSGTLGYDVVWAGRTVRAVQADVMLEASHSLVRASLREDQNLPFAAQEYRVAGPLGRIRPLDALLGRSREPDTERNADITNVRAAGVLGHRAVRLQVLETLTLRYGAHGETTLDPIEGTTHAFGLGLSAAGLFRLVDVDGSFGALADRGDIRFSYAYYGFYRDNTTEFPPRDQPWALGLTLVARWP